MLADNYLTNQAFSQNNVKDAAAQGAVEFEKALLRGWINRLWAKLTGRSPTLKKLPKRSGSRHYRGLQTVEVNRILGTEDRDGDFDADFNPLHLESRDRWAGVFNALRRGIPLPPVELTLVGDVYYVRDGHHRISAARVLGREEIEAIVTEWN
jgi:hypothetical protein